MTSHDLKDLLQTMATEGRDSVDLGEHSLIPRIRRRRRHNSAITAIAVSTAAVIAAGAYAVLPTDSESPLAVSPALQ